jgi:hypothetical protein
MSILELEWLPDMAAFPLLFVSYSQRLRSTNTRR